MKRPTVFVSSTIYDFFDMRSALKYWLGEMGLNAQLSEYNDFQKNLNINSYEACLQSVSECDYFILLIGSRCGGLYPGEDISITRKEYRVAYKLSKIGKIKKLIVFIRQDVWDAKEERKSLHKLLKDMTVFENDKPIDTCVIENYSSNILRDAEHIISFIDEVTRKEEARNGNMPDMNWVHLFNSFEDIISTLKVELKINVDLSVQIADQNIYMAVVHTLQRITYRAKSGTLSAFYLPFKDIRDKLKKYRDSITNFTGRETIDLSKEEVQKISDFLLFFRWGVDELFTYEFENALSSGIFMDFDVDNGKPLYNNFCRMLHQMIGEISRVKRFVSEFSFEKQGKMMETICNYPRRLQESYTFDFADLACLSSIYERLINIQNISFYLIRCIELTNRNIEPPMLLNGLVDVGKPLESDIMKFFESSSQSTASSKSEK